MWVLRLPPFGFCPKEDHGQQPSAKMLLVANAEEMPAQTVEDPGQPPSAKELPAAKGEKQPPQP